jgi:Ca-activated chloride channel family protein
MNFFSDITFLYPWLLYSLIILPVLIFWHYKQSKKQQTELRISTLAGLSNYQASTKQKLRHLPYILRLITIGLLIVCLARPQSSSRSKDVTTEGIDIMLAMDISGSMLAEDFKPNRIEAAKKVAIGLVIFSGESFTQCPLTTDHAVVKNQLAALQSGMVADGTAIGEGFATAVNRLKDSKAKSKVIILLTDGVNNSGSIAPITAAEIAKTFGIRTYCIGVGTIGTAPYPMKTPFGIQYQQMEVQIDEATMTSIAEVTGGKYFRATNNKSLKKIYDDIDKLEKTKIEVTEFSRHAEEFLPFAIVAAILLLLEIVLRYTVFRSIP